jgi:hypothetical protein
MNELNDLKKLWEQFLGEVPKDIQFQLWLNMHTFEVVRRGILVAAEKNLAMKGAMTFDHKLRFASSVMNSRTAEKQARTA